MRRVLVLRHTFALALLLPVLAAPALFGWGKDGHRMINYVAMEKLPANLPAFLRTPQALAEVEYLGPEPDRWRSAEEPELNAAQAPEHFIDLEWADSVEPKGLPRDRFDFLQDVYATRAKNPLLAASLTPQSIGLLPWQANEAFERLQADMYIYRTRLAQHQDTAGAEQAILYDIGVLGHYVGDGSQPLHTTLNYNGWVVRENPHGYTRDHQIHRQFETDFVHDNIRVQNLEPLVPDAARILRHPFEDFVTYLRATHQQVEATYQLEKEGGFQGKGSAASRAYVAERLANGATMLRDMIVTAWKQSGK